MDLESIFSDPDEMKRLSQRAIYNSAWWFSHSSGKPVRAKGDHRRVEWSEQLREYVLPLGKGGNSLVVSDAIRKIGRKAKEYPLATQRDLVLNTKDLVTRCVVNYMYEPYAEYPTFQNNGVLIDFGTHSINIIEFSDVVISDLRVLQGK